VLIDGRRLGRGGWSYDPASRTVDVATGAVATDRPVTVTAR
jgi:hypothetical protein